MIDPSVKELIDEAKRDFPIHINRKVGDVEGFEFYPADDTEPVDAWAAWVLHIAHENNLSGDDIEGLINNQYSGNQEHSEIERALNGDTE